MQYNNNSNIEQLLSALRGAVGEAHVLTAPGDLEPRLIEGRGLFRGEAVCIVRPASTTEVSAVVDICREAGVPIVAQGGNTGLVGGGVPQGGVILSLERMTRIRNIDPANATMTVEAGCILAKAQAAAAEAGLMFPLSLASEGSCTIGGNLATNAGGTNVLRYGNARELVLGLEVVLADGRVWHGLNALRKDNTGYDLKNLFIGAEGTLGIITAAVLKLFPAIATRATAIIGCASPDAALKLFGRLRDAAGPMLTAFEYMERFGLEIVLKHVPGAVCPLGGDHASYALIELSSPQAGAPLIEELETLLAASHEDGLIEDATIARSEAQNAGLWLLRESLSDTQKKEGGSIKHDVAVPVSQVARFIRDASAACEAMMPGLRVCAFGHFGDGNIHFNLSQPVGMDKAAFLSRWEDFNRVVHDIVASLGGSFSAEHGIGLLKRHELARYKDPVALDLMRTIKAALDPASLLNPGKVLPPEI